MRVRTVAQVMLLVVLAVYSSANLVGCSTSPPALVSSAVSPSSDSITYAGVDGETVLDVLDDATGGDFVAIGARRLQNQDATLRIDSSD